MTIATRGADCIAVSRLVDRVSIIGSNTPKNSNPKYESRNSKLKIQIPNVLNGPSPHPSPQRGEGDSMI
jgi:hypothetical protein